MIYDKDLSILIAYDELSQIFLIDFNTLYLLRKVYPKADISEIILDIAQNQLVLYSNNH